jgi:hypothetical protein
LVKGEMNMQMRSRAEVARILAEEVERALGRYRAVNGNCATPGGGKRPQLPHGDGQPHMPFAWTPKIAAILALSETLERHGEFVLNGRIPKDLGR